MCRHILNCQTYIQAPCCGEWFECAECHDEAKPAHKFKFKSILKYTCKQCKKCFSRDFRLFSEADKHCNFCNNKWVLPGITPESKIYDESMAVIDASLAQVVDATQGDYFNEM